MALTQTTSLDVVGGTSTITFYNGAQVDQITFSSNSITWQSQSTYNLSKSDLLLFIQFITFWNQTLFTNFTTTITPYVGTAFPNSVFDITRSFAGVTHITYNNTTSGTTVLNINYVPTAVSAAIATRGSPVTVTMQEFFMSIYMLQQYQVQVQVN